MIALLARALRGRPLRTFLTIAGIATCTLLVIVIVSAFRSVREAMSNYAGQPGVDLWVAPEGGDNLIRGSFISFIPLAAMGLVARGPAPVNLLLRAAATLAAMRGWSRFARTKKPNQ